jgi:hypothetical protein
VIGALSIAAGLITLLYAVSALARLVPVKRRHHTWRQVGGMSAITLVVVSVACVAFGITRTVVGGASAGPAGASNMLRSLPPNTPAVSDGMAVGVFAPGEWKSWSPVQRFSRGIGQPVRYVVDYLGPSEPFPEQLGKLAAEHGAEPVLQMMPTMSMADIAAGKDDAYLRRLAAQVGGYGHPVTLSFAPEANGNWYQFGWTRTPSAQYRAAWKHVLAEFRHVRNITWMETVNVVYRTSGPLRDYIVRGVMIGIDGYYAKHNAGHSFNSLFGSTLAQVRAETDAPVMISETAIGGAADQAAYIPNLVKSVRKKHLAGIIWFNQDQGAQGHWPLTSAGAAAMRASLRPSTIPVLLYHGIYGKTDPESDNVSLTAFRQQMAYLHKKGYQTISPRQYQLWAKGQPVELPVKPVLITDDRNQASFAQALPVLRHYHYRVVMDVVTRFANGDCDGPQGQRAYYLGWSDLKVMNQAGYIYVRNGTDHLFRQEIDLHATLPQFAKSLRNSQFSAYYQDLNGEP